jgi:hypothetical protein
LQKTHLDELYAMAEARRRDGKVDKAATLNVARQVLILRP